MVLLLKSIHLSADRRLLSFDSHVHLFCEYATSTWQAIRDNVHINLYVSKRSLSG